MSGLPLTLKILLRAPMNWNSVLGTLVLFLTQGSASAATVRYVDASNLSPAAPFVLPRIMYC